MGDTTVQMGNEIKSVPKEERDILMKEAKFTITIPPEQGLAMKANLNIPWNKLRVMRRYTIQCNTVLIHQNIADG